VGLLSDETCVSSFVEGEEDFSSETSLCVADGLVTTQLDVVTGIPMDKEGGVGFIVKNI